MNSITSARPLSFARTYTAELHEKAVTRVIELLRSNPERTWSIKDMARAAFMSPFHFIRVFKEVAGIAPCKCQWALKIDAAKQLLLRTDLSILDISLKVGYNSLGTFTRRFSELVGISPHRFRHLARTTTPAAIQSAIETYQPLFGAESVVSGRVHPPARFRGTIVVACFCSGMPQGPTLGHAIADSSHAFRVRRPAQHDFYLYAFGVPCTNANTPWFTDENLLRDRSFCTASPTNQAREELVLRPAQPTDPPILLALSVLAAPRHFAAASSAASAASMMLISRSMAAASRGT
jgi:AraC family transcriptional regulator